MTAVPGANHRRQTSLLLPRVAFTTQTDDPPAETLHVDGRTIRRQPPYVVHVCRTPPSGRAHLPCGYRAKTCTGGSAKCQACRFRFCKHHFMRHMQLRFFPPEPWISFDREVQRQLAQVVEGTRKRVRIPKPVLDEEE